MPVATIALDTQYQPPLAATISSRGLAIHQFIVQHDGKTHDILVGPQNVADFSNPAHKYQNVIIGRYSNRLPTGQFTVSKDGATAPLTSLPNEAPEVSLHGGPTGYDAAEWTPVALKDADASLWSSAEKASLDAFPEGTAVLYEHTSPDGDQGFPGTVKLQVLFALIPATNNNPGADTKELALGSFTIVYRAKVIPGNDGSKTVTPVNLTQHWGFNLDASLLSTARQPMTDVKAHVLTIDAASTVELDAVGLATGKLVPVESTPEHTHEAKLIGDLFPAKGYGALVLPYDRFLRTHMTPATPPSPPRIAASAVDSLDVVTKNGVLKPFTLSETSAPQVVLDAPKSGLSIRFSSNQPGVQFYSGNFMNGKGSRKRIHGGNGSLDEGDGYPAGSGAFLEFHEFLAAWMHPYSTPESDTLLTSDQVYNNFVRVDVVAKVLPPNES